MSRLIKAYIQQMPFILSKGDINDESFDNCLSIQMCVDSLINEGKLSPIESDILYGYFSGYNYSELSRLFNIDGQTVALMLDRVTDRIAYILGGDMSDASFFVRVFGDDVHYVQSKKE